VFICKNKEKISALLGIFVKFIEQRLDVLGAWHSPRSLTRHATKRRRRKVMRSV